LQQPAQQYQAYADVEKTFKGKRPCTICRITPKGQQAFEAYVKALKSYLKIAKK
jgi:putative heme iron utilization protein